MRGGAHIQAEAEAHEIAVDPAASLGLEGTDEETAAAARIQSMQRGKLARKELQEQKDAATKIQAAARGMKARKDMEKAVLAPSPTLRDGRYT